MEIRLLRADEIECRVGTFKDGKGLSLLLYKDARVDMNILDETFGSDNWQRNHEVINGNLFCNVGVRFERENGFGEWVWKQDVGIESYAEKEKGQASDSFKRACFNWGIGRELYTAPFIWINETNKYTKFKVKEIGYNDNREINHLVIIDDKGKERFRLGQHKSSTNTHGKEPTKANKEPQAPKTDTISEPQQRRLFALAKGNNDLVKEVLELRNLTSTKDIKKSDYESICKYIETRANG